MAGTTATTHPSRILIVRVGALGDTLMVTPLIRLLRERHPGAEIDFLCSGLAAPLLELNPRLANLFPLKGRNFPIALSPEKRRLVRKLRSRDYDLGILLESAPRYRVLLERAGLKKIRSFREFPFDPGRHAILNNLAAGGIEDPGSAGLDMDLPLAAADEEAAGRILRGVPAPRIGVHIGWGPRGRKRRQAERLRGWDRGNFVRLIRQITEAGNIRAVLTGSPEDVRDTEWVCGQVPPGRAVSIAGRTRVRELAAVIKKLDLLISVDSGPCHMAAALGTPLVVLWGPGRLEQTRPLSSTTPVCIIRHEVPCAPCQSSPLQKSCRHNLCMEAISVDEVAAAARRHLPILSAPASHEG